jgi:hypothetical protein
MLTYADVSNITQALVDTGELNPACRLAEDFDAHAHTGASSRKEGREPGGGGHALGGGSRSTASKSHHPAHALDAGCMLTYADACRRMLTYADVC